MKPAETSNQEALLWIAAFALICGACWLWYKSCGSFDHPPIRLPTRHHCRTEGT